jgi:nucleotide-binding universal stress UspA family protein
MGMHGKAKFRDLFIGTTIERVIRIGTRPVLMVKNKPAGAYKNVVAATDFSDSAQKALHIAAQIAPRTDLHILYSYDFPDTDIGMRINRYAGDVVEKIEKDKLKKFVDVNKKLLKEAGITTGKVSSRLVQGQPAVCLTKEVKKVKADLISIGVHGRAGFVSAKLGGTAEDILSDPPCDVLVAK